MKSRNAGLIASLVSLLLIQTPVSNASEASASNDPIGNPQTSLPTRPISENINSLATGTNPVFPALRDSLAIESPIKPLDKVGPRTPAVIPAARVLRSVPLPVKPKPLPKREGIRPNTPAAEPLLRKAEVFETKLTKRKKREKAAPRAPEIKTSRAGSRYEVKLVDLKILETTPYSAKFMTDLSGLNPNMEVNALLRSSADGTDILADQIVGMNCSGNSCTAFAKGLSPESSYILSLLLKDPNEQTLVELVSKNIEQRTFTTPALPAGEMLAKVKEIFLKEVPGQQTDIDEGSVMISDLAAEGCTAVAVCPKRSYNVAAKSRSGSEHVVATVALFDGKGERYVSDFRIQKKTLSAPMPRIV